MEETNDNIFVSTPIETGEQDQKELTERINAFYREKYPDWDEKNEASRKAIIEAGFSNPNRADLALIDLMGESEPMQKEDGQWGTSWRDPQFLPTDIAADPSYINEFRAQDQSLFAKWGNAGGKFAVQYATTLAQMPVMIFYGLPMAAVELAETGSVGQAFNKVFDNDVTQALQRVNEWSEETFPNYYSQAEKDMNLWQQLGTANFWADKVFKNSSFMLASITGGSLAGVAGRSLSAWRAAKKGIEMISGARSLTSGLASAGLAAFNEASIEGINAANEYMEGITAGVNERYEQDKAKLDEKYKTIGETLSAMYEANKGKNLVVTEYDNEGNPLRYDDPAYIDYNTNVETEKANYLKELEELEAARTAALQQAEADKASVGNMTTLLNVPFLMLGDMLMFTKVLSGGMRASRDVSKSLWRGPKMKYVENALWQGFEEGAQKEFSAWSGMAYTDDVMNFYEASLDPNTQREEIDYWNAFQESFSDVISDQGTAEEALVGTIYGILGAPAPYFHIKVNDKGQKKLRPAVTWAGGPFAPLREARERRAERGEAESYLEKRFNDPKFGIYYEGMVGRRFYEDRMADDLQRDDEFAFRNDRYNTMAKDVIMAAKLGRLKELKAKIKETFNNELSDEDLQSILNNVVSVDSSGKAISPFKHGLASVDKNGKPVLSSSQEEKDALRKEIRDRVDYVDQVIKDFELAEEQIEKDTGGVLSNDDMTTMAAARMQLNDLARRAYSIISDDKNRDAARNLIMDLRARAERLSKKDPNAKAPADDVTRFMAKPNTKSEEQENTQENAAEETQAAQDEAVRQDVVERDGTQPVIDEAARERAVEESVAQEQAEQQEERQTEPQAKPQAEAQADTRAGQREEQQPAVEERVIPQTEQQVERQAEPQAAPQAEPQPEQREKRKSTQQETRKEDNTQRQQARSKDTRFKSYTNKELAKIYTDTADFLEDLMNSPQSNANEKAGRQVRKFLGKSVNKRLLHNAASLMYNNDAVEELTDVDDTPRERARALIDLGRILDRYKTYWNELKGFVENPSKLRQRVEQSKKKKREEGRKAESVPLVGRLKAAKDQAEFNQVVKDHLSQEMSEEEKDTFNQVMTDLANEGNEHAKTYQRRRAAYHNLIKKVSEMEGVSDQDKAEAILKIARIYEDTTDEAGMLNANAGELADGTTAAQMVKKAISQYVEDLDSARYGDTIVNEPPGPPEGEAAQEQEPDSEWSNPEPVAAGTDEASTDLNYPADDKDDTRFSAVKKENEDLGDRQCDGEPETEGKRRFYRPVIPEIDIKGRRAGEFRPFDVVKKEDKSAQHPFGEGKNFDDIYKFLKDMGAFDFVNKGLLKVGDIIHFMKFGSRPDTVFMVVRDGDRWQVVGSLDQIGGDSIKRYLGLQQLVKKITDIEVADNESYIYEEKGKPVTVTVMKMMRGAVPYDGEERSLGELLNNDPEGARDAELFLSGKGDTRISDGKTYKVVGDGTTTGRLYIAVNTKTGNQQIYVLNVDEEAWKAADMKPEDISLHSEKMRALIDAGAITVNLQSLSPKGVWFLTSVIDEAGNEDKSGFVTAEKKDTPKIKTPDDEEKVRPRGQRAAIKIATIKARLGKAIDVFKAKTTARYTDNGNYVSRIERPKDKKDKEKADKVIAEARRVMKARDAAGDIIHKFFDKQYEGTIEKPKGWTDEAFERFMSALGRMKATMEKFGEQIIGTGVNVHDPARWRTEKQKDTIDIITLDSKGNIKTYMVEARRGDWFTNGSPRNALSRLMPFTDNKGNPVTVRDWVAGRMMNAMRMLELVTTGGTVTEKTMGGANAGKVGKTILIPLDLSFNKDGAVSRVSVVNTINLTDSVYTKLIETSNKNLGTGLVLNEKRAQANDERREMGQAQSRKRKSAVKRGHTGQLSSYWDNLMGRATAQMTEQDAKGEIVSLLGKLAETLHVPVKVINDVNEIEDEGLKKIMEDTINKGDLTVFGVYRFGNVYMYMPSFSFNNKYNTSKDAKGMLSLALSTYLHEVVGHYGLRALLGVDSFRQLLESKLKAEGHEVGHIKGQEEGEYERLMEDADEQFARMAENMTLNDLEDNAAALTDTFNDIRKMLLESMSFGQLKFDTSLMSRLLYMSFFNLINQNDNGNGGDTRFMARGEKGYSMYTNWDDPTASADARPATATVTVGDNTVTAVTPKSAKRMLDMMRRRVASGSARVNALKDMITRKEETVRRLRDEYAKARDMENAVNDNDHVASDALRMMIYNTEPYAERERLGEAEEAAKRDNESVKTLERYANEPPTVASVIRWTDRQETRFKVGYTHYRGAVAGEYHTAYEPDVKGSVEDIMRLAGAYENAKADHPSRFKGFTDIIRFVGSEGRHTLEDIYQAALNEESLKDERISRNKVNMWLSTLLWVKMGKNYGLDELEDYVNTVLGNAIAKDEEVATALAFVNNLSKEVFTAARNVEMMAKKDKAGIIRPYNIRFTHFSYDKANDNYALGEAVGNVIRLNVDRARTFGMQDDLAMTMLHELIHTVSAYMYEYAGQFSADPHDGYVKNYSLLNDVYSDLLAHPQHDTEGDKIKDYYGANHPMEALAELANVSFITRLLKERRGYNISDNIILPLGTNVSLRDYLRYFMNNINPLVYEYNMMTFNIPLSKDEVDAWERQKVKASKLLNKKIMKDEFIRKYMDRVDERVKDAGAYGFTASNYQGLLDDEVFFDAPSYFGEFNFGTSSLEEARPAVLFMARRQSEEDRKKGIVNKLTAQFKKDDKDLSRIVETVDHIIRISKENPAAGRKNNPVLEQAAVYWLLKGNLRLPEDEVNLIKAMEHFGKLASVTQARKVNDKRDVKAEIDAEPDTIKRLQDMAIEAVDKLVESGAEVKDQDMAYKQEYKRLYDEEVERRLGDTDKRSALPYNLDYRFFEGPADVNSRYDQWYESNLKPVNPDTMSRLKNKKVLGDSGITIYDVDETDEEGNITDDSSKEARRQMRHVINTHFGENANPWCLLCGDGHGKLTEDLTAEERAEGHNGQYDSKYYWGEYNAFPKRVAFYNGKLTAFFANDDPNEPVWWSRNDNYYEGAVPVLRGVPDDEMGRVGFLTFDEETGETDGKLHKIHKGNPFHGEYKEWDDTNGEVGGLMMEQFVDPDDVDTFTRKYYSVEGDGKVGQTEKFIHGVGVITTYNEDGGKVSETHYLRDKRHGDSFQFDVDGLVEVHERYDHGKKVGLQQYYNTYEDEDTPQLSVEQFFVTDSSGESKKQWEKNYFTGYGDADIDGKLQSYQEWDEHYTIMKALHQTERGEVIKEWERGKGGLKLSGVKGPEGQKLYDKSEYIMSDGKAYISRTEFYKEYWASENGWHNEKVHVVEEYRYSEQPVIYQSHFDLFNAMIAAEERGDKKAAKAAYQEYRRYDNYVQFFDTFNFYNANTPKMGTKHFDPVIEKHITPRPLDKENMPKVITTEYVLEKDGKERKEREIITYGLIAPLLKITKNYDGLGRFKHAYVSFSSNRIDDRTLNFPVYTKSPLYEAVENDTFVSDLEMQGYTYEKVKNMTEREIERVFECAGV